jgi:cytochrome c553
MNGRSFRIVAACGLAALTMLLPTAARPQAPGSVPAEWTTVPGWNVFVDKGCGTCHRVRGVGDGTIGPDLAGLRASRSLFDLGAAMWNHLPQMGAAMRDTGTQPPRLTPLEFSSLAAFLFTTQYDGTSGDPVKGSRLFTAKSCARSAARWAAGAAPWAPLSTVSSGPGRRSSWLPPCGTMAPRWLPP